MRDQADLESVHRFSSQNRELLARSDRAGCFYCRRIYDPGEIRDWVDGPVARGGDLRDGVTALCPRCGIDAVLPSAAVPLDDGLLADMHRYWF